MAITPEKTLAKRVGGKRYVLSPHATTRLLERSSRAPAWLAEVVQKGQFAYLQFGQPNRRRYALVFDALEQAYLVAILGVDHLEVITVLTLVQYENTYGPVAPVFFKLAQLARAQGPGDSAANAKSPEKPVLGEVAGELCCEEDKVTWTVYLLFANGNGTYRQLVRHMPVSAWTSWIREELREEAGRGVAVEPLTLTFPQRLALLTQSPQFHTWLLRKIRKKQEHLCDLARVMVKPKIDGVSRKEITENLCEHLAHHMGESLSCS